MKKMKLIAGAAILGVAFAGVAVGVGVASRQDAVAGAYVATPETGVASGYVFGEEFVVPNATIAYKGEDIPATKSVIVYPSGAIYAGGTHVLQEEGEYTIIYYATVSGETISAEITFRVGKPITIDGETKPVLDTTAPVLTLHKGFAQNVEHKVAIGETVTIPSATAEDENLQGGVMVSVYYNYGTDKEILINTQGGTFTPTKVGRYTFVYSACDTFGNQTEKVVHISCGKTDNDKAATLLSTGFSGEAGAWIDVPNCVVSGLYEDDALVKVYAQFEDEKEEIENNRYFPRHVGTYQIVYELETPFAKYQTSVDFATISAGHAEIQQAYLPKYFIKNYSYSLDDVLSSSYTEKNPVEAPAQAYISQDGGEYTQINHKDFKITAEQKVQFKFVCGEAETQSQEIKVVDVGAKATLQPQKYFYDASGALTAVATESNVLYSIQNGAGDYSLDFINVLSLSSFSLDFVVPAQDTQTQTVYNEMSAIEIIVTDYYDASNQVVARYENNGSTLNVSLNGGKRITIARAFTGVKSKFAYSNGVFLDSTSGTELPFSGSFTSDKVFVSVKMVGVEGDAGIGISAVANQSFTERTTRDAIAPTVYIADLQMGIKELGATAVLNPAQVTDVLSPFLEKNLGITVTDPNGDFVTSVDGVLLNGTCSASVKYEIKLEQHGDYVVMYSYTDQNGNNMPIRYAINVPERIKPTIQLQGVNANDIVLTQVNTKVKIADFTVSDDTSTASEIRSYVYVSSPDFTTAEIDENGYFNVRKAGDYTVMYTCYDLEGNFTIVTYIVRAS